VWLSHDNTSTAPIESEHNLGRNIYLVNYAARTGGSPLSSIPFRLVCTRSRRHVSGETVTFVCGTCVKDTIAGGRLDRSGSTLSAFEMVGPGASEVSAPTGSSAPNAGSAGVNAVSMDRRPPAELSGHLRGIDGHQWALFSRHSENFVAAVTASMPVASRRIQISQRYGLR
jgi:hypothetical protein